MTELVAGLQVNLTHCVAGKVGGTEAKCDDFGCQRSLCGEGIGNWGGLCLGYEATSSGARARSTGGLELLL